MSKTKLKIQHIARRALSLAEFLLIELFEEIDDFNFSVRYPYATMGRSARLAREYYEDNQREWEAALKRREMRRLKERKFITLRKEGDEAIAALTTDGKIFALKTIIRNIDKLLPEGQQCLVSFDVPEASRKLRLSWRRLLKKFEFRFLHGSVWVTERDVVGEMRALVFLAKIEKYVKVFKTLK